MLGVGNYLPLHYDHVKECVEVDIVVIVEFLGFWLLRLSKGVHGMWL